MLTGGVLMEARGKPGSGFTMEQEGRERSKWAWKTRGFRYERAAAECGRTGRTGGDGQPSREGLSVWGSSNTETAEQSSKAESASFSVPHTPKSTGGKFHFIPLTDYQFTGCLFSFFLLTSSSKQGRIFWLPLVGRKGHLCENVFFFLVYLNSYLRQG